MIRINANLFRLAFLASSTEETRYYLCGVFVEPHPAKGVTLTATDGHRLVSLYDENGHADAPAIVRLSADALKLCKMQKVGVRTIEIQVETEIKGNASLYDTIGDDRAIVGISAGNCLVGGTFPDWRRVVLDIKFDKPSAAAFDGKYLAAFGTMAKELCLAFDVPKYDSNRKEMPSGLTVYASDKGGPSLVRWCGVEQAFGVLMPVTNPTPDARLPTFFQAFRPASAAA